ncbi:DUF1700 domain-containing protein [Furfurilactobacillus curtus]|uniref:Membrane protein n=1 Tax=Furfurilactobacillus curtus TaxID=1746200 RepID=A0ABQ5JKL6_9LACO
MTNETYLSELQRRLHGLTEEERADVLDFYTEYIEDANLTDGDEIIAKLGTPKQLARKVLADYSIKENETAEQNGERRSPRSNATMVWLIILAVLSTPVTIPAAIGIILILLLVIFMAILAVGLAVVLAITLLAAGMMVAGVSLYTGFWLLGSHIFIGIAYIGIGLTGLGGALVLMPLFYYIVRWLIQMIANFIRFAYRKFSNRRQQPRGGQSA